MIPELYTTASYLVNHTLHFCFETKMARVDIAGRLDFHNELHIRATMYQQTLHRSYQR
jgi:hypothetical protein